MEFYFGEWHQICGYLTFDKIEQQLRVFHTMT